MTTKGGGEWEPQISFEIFGHCTKIKPQEANKINVTTMTLEKGGCSQLVTTKRAGCRKSDYRTNRQENETLHFYGEEGRSQILDTQTNRWQEHLDKLYGTVED
jgi:FtsZ-binding cell division protein ZapB